MDIVDVLCWLKCANPGCVGKKCSVFMF